MTKPFDLEKAKATMTAQTRSGLPVRILCTDRKSHTGWTIVGLILTPQNDELIQSWYDNGSVYACSDDHNDLDLINVPTKRSGVVAILKDPLPDGPLGYVFSNEGHATRNILRDTILRFFPAEWEELECIVQRMTLPTLIAEAKALCKKAQLQPSQFFDGARIVIPNLIAEIETLQAQLAASDEALLAIANNLSTVVARDRRFGTTTDYTKTYYAALERKAKAQKEKA